MVVEGDSVIGFGFMVKGVDFYLVMEGVDFPFFTAVHLTFGQYHSSHSSKNRYSKELVCVLIFSTLKEM